MENSTSPLLNNEFGAAVRNCQSCGSIQRADIACPICGYATGPMPGGTTASKLRDIRRAEWVSLTPVRRQSGENVLERAQARRAAWLAARDKAPYMVGLIGLEDFYLEELALIEAGVGQGVAP